MKGKRTRKQILNDEKFFIQEFEKLLKKDFEKEIEENRKARKKMKRRAQYALKKFAETKSDKYKKSYENKLRSISFFNQNEKEIENAYGFYTVDKLEEVEASNKIEMMREYLENNPEKFFFAEFNYDERKKIMQFVFENVEIKKFRGKPIKKNADSLIKLIDKILSEINYDYFLIIQIDKNNIVDVFLVLKSEFEEL